jgi:hypothetical protein
MTTEPMPVWTMSDPIIVRGHLWSLLRTHLGYLRGEMARAASAQSAEEESAILDGMARKLADAILTPETECPSRPTN